MKSLSPQHLSNPLPSFHSHHHCLGSSPCLGNQTRAETFALLISIPFHCPHHCHNYSSKFFVRSCHALVQISWITSPFLPKKKFRILKMTCADFHNPAPMAVQSPILLTFLHPKSKPHCVSCVCVCVRVCVCVLCVCIRSSSSLSFPSHPYM